MLLRRAAPFLARNNPCSLPILLHHRDLVQPPRARASGGKRKATAPAASAAPSRTTARGFESDSDWSDGASCPSDDEQPPSEASGDEDDEESDEEAEVELEDVSKGGAKAKGKKKTPKKLTKAEKDKLKDDQWIDLTQDEQLPAPPADEKSTGHSEKGGPSEACKRRAGDHPLLYFQDMGFDDDMLQQLADNSNMYASGQGAGTTKCFGSFKPFTVMDMKIGISLLIRNGLAPVPQMRLHWVQDSFVYGDVRVQKLWSRARWEEFKSLFHIEPPLPQVVKETGNREKDAAAYAKYDPENLAVHYAHMFCNGCKTHFCGGACFREFHFPGVGD